MIGPKQQTFKMRKLHKRHPTKTFKMNIVSLFLLSLTNCNISGADNLAAKPQTRERRGILNEIDVSQISDSAMNPSMPHKVTHTGRGVKVIATPQGQNYQHYEGLEEARKIQLKHYKQPLCRDYRKTENKKMICRMRRDDYGTNQDRWWFDKMDFVSYY